MPLDIKKHFQEIDDLYKKNSRRGKANFLLYGNSGTGKTRLSATAPGPLLIHSFDPGGTTTIQSMLGQDVIKTEVIIDDRYEIENAEKPDAYTKWWAEVNKLMRADAFDSFGTFILDSGTMWLQAMMNMIVGKDGRGGQTPRIQDYGTQQLFASDALKQLCALPCNFIMTGHVDTFKDEAEGRIHTSLMASGKNRVKIPLLFDELLVTQAKQSRVDGDLKTVYSVLTKGTERIQARTRIGAEGKFDSVEKADIRALLKKAGYPWEDKKSLLTKEDNKT